MVQWFLGASLKASNSIQAAFFYSFSLVDRYVRVNVHTEMPVWQRENRSAKKQGYSLKICQQADYRQHCPLQHRTTKQNFIDALFASLTGRLLFYYYKNITEQELTAEVGSLLLPMILTNGDVIKELNGNKVLIN